MRVYLGPADTVRTLKGSEGPHPKDERSYGWKGRGRTYRRRRTEDLTKVSLTICSRRRGSQGLRINSENETKGPDLRPRNYLRRYTQASTGTEGRVVPRTGTLTGVL